MILFNRASAKCLLAIFVLSASSMPVFAHDIYIWPSYFTINSDKPTMVPVDVTATHTTFRPDFSMPSNAVHVYGVDGKEMRRRGNYYEGARRSTFDLKVEKEGTYLLSYFRIGRHITFYELGKSDKPKRVSATKREAKDLVPKKAKNVVTKRYDTIATSYLTNKAPTSAVLEPKKEGFEVVPITHPADYVTGEEIVISTLFDGKPVKDLDIIIEQEGPQYRAEPLVLELKSDEQGQVRFTLNEGGRYIFKTNHDRKSDDKRADRIVTRAYYAFEVIYE